MTYKKFLGAASAALMIVVAIFLLVTGALAANKFKTLHTFTGGKDGGSPEGSLILDQAGNLYGTTAYGGDVNSTSCTYGCGVVFKLTPKTGGGWTETALHRFTGGVDGAHPSARLIFDTAGNLYGTTFWGGNVSYCSSNGCGVVFKLSPKMGGGWTESVLYTFTGGVNGSNPAANLIFDQAGNLYGTTLLGGNPWQCENSGCGVVFKLVPQAGGGWTEDVLYAFCSLTNCADGANPYLGGLVFDQAGNLYGTTEEGGASTNKGTVFRLIPNSDGSWSESVLYSFCPVKPCRDGRSPEFGLTFDQAGNLYSTATWGGSSDKGVVFKLAPNADGTWTRSVIYSFAGGTDGAYPSAGLIFDTAGNLYGTTSWGGNLSQCQGGGCGVVFKLVPNSNGGWKETVLHVFASKPGLDPSSGLIFDPAGNLYGTTLDGGHTPFGGTIFQITP